MTTENHPPKAVIFDFDGVILESADIKTEAFLALFADYPEHRESILRHHLDNMGISRYRKFEWIYAELLGRDLDERESRQLGEAFSDIALGKILACPDVPGALECLETLQNRVMLFVASGTPQEELDLIVERRGLRKYFSAVFGTPRSKVEIITSILSEQGLAKSEVVFIGDGLSDYDAAIKLGIPFIARDSASAGIEWEPRGVVAVTDLDMVLPLLGMATDSVSQE